jgi:hypothetical protein
MGLENVPRCQHVKVNGTQCGSPALRRRRRCYFHDCIARHRRKIAANETTQGRFDLPLLEDANAVQIALMKVMQMLGSGQMDHKTAGLMLYALQTASVNLRNTDFEARKATDVVIDRDTVAATCMNGPQWFAEDFDEVEEEELVEDEDESDEDEAIEDEADSAGDASDGDAPVETLVTDNLVTDKKKPESVRKVEVEKKHVTVEEARAGAQAIIRNWIVEEASKAVKPV